MKDWAKRELRVICFTAKHGTLKDRNKDRSAGIQVNMFAMVEHSHMSMNERRFSYLIPKEFRVRLFSTKIYHHHHVIEMKRVLGMIYIAEQVLTNHNDSSLIRSLIHSLTLSHSHSLIHLFTH